METLILIVGGLVGSFILWDLATRKFIDKYNSVCMFGPKGVGKTSMLQKIAYEWADKFEGGIYSNADLIGTIKINGKDIGKKNFPEDSLVLIDEIGILFPSRDFKNFGLDRIEWFKLQRHNKVKIVSCSQGYEDTDKQLRDLYDELWIMRKYLRILTIAKQVVIKIDIHNGLQADNSGSVSTGGKIVTEYRYGMKRMYCYIPHWVTLFNSFTVPERELIKGVYTDMTVWQRKLLPFKGYVSYKWRLRTAVLGAQISALVYRTPLLKKVSLLVMDLKLWVYCIFHRIPRLGYERI